jgi:hypothetical protein
MVGGEYNSKFAACGDNCAACASAVDAYMIAGPCRDKNGTEVYGQIGGL